MRLETLNSMRDWCWSFDVETYRIEPGLIVPPLVLASACAFDTSVADLLDIASDAERTGRVAEAASIRAEIAGRSPWAGELLSKSQAVELFRALLADRRRIISGANIAFDLLVMARRLLELGIDPFPDLYAALMDDQRIFDIQLAEQLDAVAEGCLGRDPRTGGPLVSPETGRRGAYSLSIVTDLLLGRTDAKALGHVATEYGQYDDRPLNELPPEMQAYPIDDSRNTLENTLAQAGFVPRAGAHRWGPQTVCEWCGVHPKEAYVDGTYQPCRVRRRSRNLHDLGNQVGTAFAMQLAAARGFLVDQASVDLVEADALDGRAEAEEPFVEAGLLKRNRDNTTSRDMSAICRAVATAYGAGGQCPTCAGTRKVVSPKAKLVKCPLCTALKSADATARCGRCAGTGQIPDPKQLVNCTACGATGFDMTVAGDVPKTETGRVSTGRDVLNESGDETLMGLADHLEDAKVLDVYVPWLRRGRRPKGGHNVGSCPAAIDPDENCSGHCAPYVSIPLTLWPNVILETGRTSYRGVVQLLPRKPGHKSKRTGEWVPSIRECIVARPGYVFSSEDYDSGELVTHAQSCIWIVGMSKLAEALVGGLKVHNKLGAQMIGMGYDEFIRRAKEQAYKDARQAAKPGNFGFPGGMGALKMVLQQRKQGPDTPHPSGPTMVKDDSGQMVPGYKGLRFCILMDNAPRCGEEMARSWPPGKNARPISPTCKRCIECASRLKEKWLEAWPENATYFQYVNDAVENGQLIDPDFLDMWPWLKPWFVANKRLAPGEIMQHVSGRVRGGLDYCSMANGFFQGLLADIAKSALRRISRECYDKTVRVPSLAHANSIKSAYADGPSPLFGHRPILFAHDEIILEHPESEAHDGAMRVSEIMVEEMRYYCPDLAPACTAEPTLMRRWFKGASPLWNVGKLDKETGKRDRGKRATDVSDNLIPWEPKR